MKIKINDKEIELKQTIRSLLMFENIKGETYFPKTLNDILLYIYCVVVSSSKDYTLDYDAFIDWIDENPNELEKINMFLEQTQENQNNIKKNKNETE